MNERGAGPDFRARATIIEKFAGHGDIVGTSAGSDSVIFIDEEPNERRLKHFDWESLRKKLISAELTEKKNSSASAISDEEGLKESVRQNLNWILNSRTSLTRKAFDTEELTVSEYGIPDFGAISPAHHEDRRGLEHSVRRAISAFEPRLQAVRVEVFPEMKDERSLWAIIIHAVISEASIREPVMFVKVNTSD